MLVELLTRFLRPSTRLRHEEIVSQEVSWRGTSQNGVGFAGNRASNRLATMRAPFDGPTRRAVFEILEERAMLTVAQDLQNLIAPYQSAVNTALSAATSLPLVGHQLTALQDLSTLLQNSLQSIETTVQNVTSGHYQFSVPLLTISHSFPLNLGLDAFLKITTNGSVTASITPVLNIGFDDNDGNISLDTADTNLDIGFSLSLPGFTGSATFNGLLYAGIADQGTNFDGHLIFGFDDNDQISPQFSGDAHVRFGLTLSFVDPSLHASFNPTFTTQLQLDWGINTATNQLTAPTIALKNFSLDADSFLHGFMGDIVTSIQKYTKPLEPFIDMFDQPVPILSAFDSSETMGDLFLGNLSGDQRASFELMVKVVKAINTIDLSGSTGGAQIDFGDINLTGDATQAGAFNFDTSQLQNVIGTIFNSPALHVVEDALQKVASYAGDDADGGMTFPLLENPGPVIVGILTGQTQTMFSFSTGTAAFRAGAQLRLRHSGPLRRVLDGWHYVRRRSDDGVRHLRPDEIVQRSEPQSRGSAARLLLRRQRRPGSVDSQRAQPQEDRRLSARLRGTVGLRGGNA